MKKKFLYKSLSLLLAMVMLFTTAPLSVFSVANEEAVGEIPVGAASPETSSTEETLPKKSATINLPDEPEVYELKYENGYMDQSDTGFAKGSGSETDPYVIQTGAQLKYFADQVNGGNSFSGSNIRLDDNINLNGYNWTPIGVSATKPFMGHFDGNYHEVKNLKIQHSSGKAADSEVFYIGFFGYVKNATVQNLGIDSYTLNQTYNYNTEIGGMVAHAAGNSKITNCYANGNIGATFEDVNPLDRSSVTKLTSVPETLSASDACGKGVIIDLRNHDAAINKTMTISENVSAVRILGFAGRKYTGFSIAIADHSHFPLLIELINVDICGNSTKGTFYGESDRTVFIHSFGTENVIRGTINSPAINIPEGCVTVSGTAPLSTIGGNGSTSQGSGNSGGDGASAIICSQLQITSGITVNATGGDGGDGNNGSSGDDGTSDNRDGQPGGNGGNGGNGAPAVIVNALFINHTSAGVVFQGGTGGDGGTGGNGGNGEDAPGHKWEPAKRKGGDGGNGGNGGAAGCGGYGLVCNTSTPIILTTVCKINAGSSGDGGDGGNGGNGGDGGDGFWAQNNGLGGCGGSAGDGGATYDSCPASNVAVLNATVTAGGSGEAGLRGTIGEKGNNGSKGWNTDSGTRNDGSRGDDGETFSTTAASTDDTIVQNISSHPAGSSAILAVGGFAGVVDSGSSVTNCACIVNDVKAKNGINAVYSYNTVNSGNFVCDNTGSISNIIAVSKQGDQLTKYDISKWFSSHEDTRAEGSVSILTPYGNGYYADALGLIYDCGVTDKFTISQSHTVWKAIPKESNIVVPNYVYSGRFLTAVTKIGRSVFAGSSIESIDTGDSVTEIGANAFAECEDLKTVRLGDAVSQIEPGLLTKSHALVSVHIGKSLVDIPDIEISKTPFGIDKEQARDFNAYTVTDGNTKYAAESGILYELFPNKIENKSLKVAVVDVPVKVNIASTYTPQKRNSDGTVAADNTFYILKIYPYAFAYNTKIKEVHLDYIREIGTGAFSNSSRLEKVFFGQYKETAGTVKILEEEYQEALERYSTVVGGSAFANCRRLHQINLEANTLTQIGLNAFYNCASAEDVEPMSVTLGKNISMISIPDDEKNNNLETEVADMLQRRFSSAFSEAKIREFKVVSGNKTFIAKDGVLYYYSGERANGTNKAVVWLAAYPRNARATVYTVENNPANDYVITYISPGAFSGAENLEKLIIGAGITQVGYETFTHMTAMHTLEIGKDIKVLNKVDSLFDGCGALERICVDAQNTSFSDDDGVLLNKEQTQLLKYPAAKPGSDYETPATVNAIGARAFSRNENIRHVTLTNAITSVGTEAFYHCPNLSFIYFKKGDCPFTSAEAMIEGDKFFTTNSRVLVCFGEEVENSRWTDVSTEEANQKYYDEVSTEAGEKPRRFQVAKYTAYPTDIKDTGYYAFVVVDKSGALLNNINVSLEGSDAVNTVNGIAMFESLAYDRPYQLTVFDNQSEYFPFVNNRFYLDESTRITYITLSSVPTLSGVSVTYSQEAAKKKVEGLFSENAATSIYAKGEQGYDLNSETAKINKWMIDEVVIRVSCGLDPETTLNNCRLIQNGKEIPAVNIHYSERQTAHGKDFITIDITVKTADLLNEQDIYAAVQTTNGLVETKLNIHIFEMEFSAIDLSFLSHGIELEIPQQLQALLGSKKYDKNEDDKKGWKFEVSLEPDSYKVQIAYNWNFGEHEEGFDQIDPNRPFESWKNYVNSAAPGLLSAPENRGESGWSFSCGGYIDFQYKGLDKNGKPDYAVESAIFGQIGFTATCGTTIQLWVFPVRLEAELSVDGKLQFVLVFDKDAKQFLTPSLQFELKGALTAYAGIGVSCISVGVYGKIETILVLDIAPKFELNKWTASGEFGAYLKAKLGPIKLKYTVKLLDLFNETLYEKPKDAGSALLAAMYDPANYELQTSSYNPRRKVTSPTGNIEDPAYSGTAPKMLQVGDLIYIVYQDDLARYNEEEDKYYYTDYQGTYDVTQYDRYNYQKLVYQIYDTTSGKITAPVVLHDNGYADGDFDLCYDSKNQNVVVAYTQLNTRLDSEMVGKINSESAGNTDVYTSLMDIKIACLTENEIMYRCLTKDSYMDYNIRLGVTNGKLTAVWVKNANNSIFGCANPAENKMSAICYSVYDNGKWGDVTEIGGLNTITDIEFENGCIAYITDTNNDLTTAVVNGQIIGECFDDRTVTLLNIADGSTVTSGENAYMDISVLDGNFTYLLDNNLYMITTVADKYVVDTQANVQLFGSAIDSLTEGYTVLEDAQGNSRAILYIASSETASNIYGIFCDNGQWGSPIQLTNYTDNHFVNSFDAVDRDGKMLLSVLLAQPDMSGAENADGSVTEQYIFDTYTLSYPTGYTVGKITFAHNELVENKNVILSIPITNSSYQSLHYTDIPVSVAETTSCTVVGFYDEDGNALDNHCLPSGNTGYLKISFNPGYAREAAYNVTINGETYPVTLWYSDFAVSAKQVVIGDTNYISMLVTNTGHLAGSYKVSVITGKETTVDENGNVVVLNTGTKLWDNNGQAVSLTASGSKYFLIPLETTFGEASRLVDIVIDADNEEMTANNQIAVNVTTEEDLSEQVQLSLKTITLDRNSANSEPIDIAFEDGYIFKSVLVDGEPYRGTIQSQEDSVIFDRNSMLSVLNKNGVYAFTMVFLDANGKEKKANLIVTATEYFTITWEVDDKTFVDSLEIGTVPAHSDPEKEKDAQYTYTFVGWDYTGDGIADEILAADSDITYTAIFSKELNSYTVTWNIEGKATNVTCAYGTVPAYDGTPEKVSDVQYDYVFAGWDKEIAAVTGDITYTAVFDAVTRKYTVTLDVDGTQSTMQVEYGVTPVLPEAVKTSDAQYAYTFTGWSPAVSPVYGNQTYTAQFASSLQQYTVTWSIDGKETKVTYNYGTLPVFDASPYKAADNLYIYQFTGWDKEFAPVVEDTTYTAIFANISRTYTITFMVNGAAHSQSCTYGEIPVFTGETHKNADETHRYVFTGWDKEITAAYENTTYTAQYHAVPLGSATITNTAVETVWNHTFTTTLSLSDVQTMTSTTIILYYDARLVELQEYRCLAGVTLTEEDGYLIVAVEGLSENETRDILELSFLTKDSAAIGEADFIGISGEDKITSEFGKIKLYQPGDVNMDGRVNTIDAAMVQRYAVKKLSLTDVQKAYANVTGDYDANGFDLVNTVDAAMIQRYAVKKINTLGQRISVTFVNDRDGTYTVSLVKGSDMDPAQLSVVGYVWSLSQDTYIPVDFKVLTEDTTLYCYPTSYTVIYDGNGATAGSTQSSAHIYDEEKALTANGFQQAYTVTYNYNGNGSENSTATATYTFAGWKDANGKHYGDGAVVEKLTPDAEITLFAQWNPGTVLLPTATKPGYTFAGWYTDPGCTAGSRVGNAGDAYVTTGDIMLYAKWALTQYTVVYDGNGATGGSTVATEHLYNGKTALRPNGFVREYTVSYNAEGVSNSTAIATYTFAGWKDASGRQYENKALVEKLTNEPEITLFAQWEPASIVLPTPVRTGYTVAGWYTDPNCTAVSKAGNPGDIYMPTADTVLYAKWTPVTYTVVYNGNGATAGSTQSSAHVYDEEKALTANGFKRVYTVTYNYNGNGMPNSTATATYTFASWKDNSGKQYANKAVVKNLTNDPEFTLFAQWDAESVVLPTPTKPGYTFAGWYINATCTSKAGNGGATYTPTGNITLYAKWIANKYIILYDGNGATGGNTPASSHTYNVQKVLTANGFIREYKVVYNFNGNGTLNSTVTATYTFAGWKDNSGKHYGDQAVVEKLTDSSGITLFAQWDPASIVLPTPTKTGYTFAGWYTDTACTNKVGDAGAVYTPTSSITLYAKWTPVTYTVVYNGNGATGGNTPASAHIYDVEKALTANGFVREYTVVYNYNENSIPNSTATATYTFAGWKDNSGKQYEDSAVVINLTNNPEFTLFAQWNAESVVLPTPTKTGYYLVGWYTDAACTNKVGDGGATYAPTGNITLYAKWTANTYTVTYNANGGTYQLNSSAVSTSTETKTYGSKYETLPTPTRLNCTFDGWYIGSTKVDSSTKVTTASNHTLVAKWSPATSGSWTTGDREEIVTTSGRTEYWQTGLNRDALKAAGYTEFTIKISMDGKFNSKDLFKADWWFEIYDPANNMIVEENEEHWSRSWENREYSYTISLDTIRDDGTIKVWYDHGGDGADDFTLGKLQIWTTAKK